MKKTRSLLLSGITCILISAVPMFVYSISNHPGKKSPSPNCPTVTYKTITLNLSFNTGNVNGCGVPESPFSDFQVTAGVGTLSDNSKYFCKITVIPNMPSGCTAPSSGVSYWTAAGGSKQISIPKNLGSSVTVEFYERCAQDCMTRTAQRRYFKYETTLLGSESFMNAPLAYIRNVNC